MIRVANCMLVGAILVILVAVDVHSQSGAENRINGVAEFLYERANANATYVLQRKMGNNRLLRCYLPETYKSATSSNLGLLLQSGPELWKDSVEADLRNFGVQLVFNNVSTETLRGWADEIDEKYIELLRKVKVRVGDRDYDVTSTPLSAPPEVRRAINSFYEDYLEFQNEFRANIREIAESRGDDSGGCPSTPYGSIGSVLGKLGERIDDLSKQLSRFQDAEVIWIGSQTTLSPGQVFHQSAVQIALAKERMRYYEARIQALNEEGSVAVRMFKLDQLIRTSILSGDNPIIDAVAGEEFEDFSRYALTFAALTEAQSAAQVKAAMRQLTLPPVSFAVKRERGANRVLLAAYFGASVGHEFGPQSDFFYGLFVPVGVELSHGFGWGSTSLMLAPLDFASPVNQIMNSQGGVAEFKDILSPGAYFTLGIKDYPLVVGVGYSHGSSIRSPSAGNRGRAIVFVGIDMPLLSLH